MPVVKDASTRALKIFDMLVLGPYSRAQMCEQLKEYNLGVNELGLTKYLRTFRELGYKVKTKRCQRFDIIAPFKIKLSEEQKYGFCVLDSIVKRFYPKAKEDFFKKNTRAEIVKRLKAGYLDERIEDVYKKMQYVKNKKTLRKISILERYLGVFEAELKIKYGNSTIYAVPKEISYGKNITLKTLAAETNSIRTLNIESIEEIEVNTFFPEKRKGALNPVTFAIKGRLRHNYILKEGERAYYMPDKTIVVNEFENKDELYSRLLKYGEYCEVMYPEKERNIFERKVQSLLETYLNRKNQSSM